MNVFEILMLVHLFKLLYLNFEEKKKKKEKKKYISLSFTKSRRIKAINFRTAISFLGVLLNCFFPSVSQFIVLFRRRKGDEEQ